MMKIKWIELTPSDEGVLNRSPQQLQVPLNATVPQVLAVLGYSPNQVELLLSKKAIAVFGLYATAQTVLHPNDRLEILDELQYNPMESRRRRIAHKIQREGKKPPRKSMKRVQIDLHKDTE